MVNKYYVGIDLGTTNSSLAILDPMTNKVEVKRVDVGEKPLLIRTILSKSVDGQWIVGNQAAAIDQLRDRTVFSIKTELRKNMKYEITIDDDNYNLEDLYYIFMRELIAKAGIASPRLIERLCLSIPVQFDENRKSVMEKAAARLLIPSENIWFVDEPISVLWDCQQIQGQYVLIFDFGGGTLDMAIMDKFATEDEREGTVEPHRQLIDQDEDEDDNRFKGTVLAKVGMDLGGDNLDDVIIRHIVELGKQQGNPVCESINLEVFDDPERLHKLKTHPKFTFYYQLKSIAEKAKQSLSVHDLYTVDVPPLVPGLDPGIKGVTITAEQFMLATEDIRNQMLRGLKKLVDIFNEKTNLNRENIEAILLSGGSSLVSFVPDLLEELFPNARIVWDEQHLQTRIARGNARYTRSEGEILVGDPVNAAFGIYNHAGKETIAVIQDTEQYPIQKVKRVATTKANQKVIEIIPMMKKGDQTAFEPLKKNGRQILWRMNIQPHQQTLDLSRLSVTYTIDKSQKLRIHAYDHLYRKEVGVEEISLTES